MTYADWLDASGINHFNEKMNNVITYSVSEDMISLTCKTQDWKKMKLNQDRVELKKKQILF